VLVTMFLPASVGILISEAFAIRSWLFHVLNGVASSWPASARDFGSPCSGSRPSVRR
jgi:hypothetical protein